MRKQRGQLSIGEGRSNGQATTQNPSKKQAAGGAGLPRDVRSNDKDAGPDHRAHDDCRRRKQPHSLNKLRRSRRLDRLLLRNFHVAVCSTVNTRECLPDFDVTNDAQVLISVTAKKRKRSGAQKGEGHSSTDFFMYSRSVALSPAARAVREALNAW